MVALTIATLYKCEHLKTFYDSDLAEISAFYRKSLKQLKHTLLKVKAPNFKLLVIIGNELEPVMLVLFRYHKIVFILLLQRRELRAPSQIRESEFVL